MSVVQTINGPIDSSELGRTLSHEHFTAGAAGMERLPWVFNLDDAVDANVEALKRVKQAGIASLIDLTPFDLGRQPALFQRVAAANTGVSNLIPIAGPPGIIASKAPSTVSPNSPPRPKVTLQSGPGTRVEAQTAPSAMAQTATREKISFLIAVVPLEARH